MSKETGDGIASSKRMEEGKAFSFFKTNLGSQFVYMYVLLQSDAPNEQYNLIPLLMAYIYGKLAISIITISVISRYNN